MAHDRVATDELRQLELKPNPADRIVVVAPLISGVVVAAALQQLLPLLDPAMLIPTWWLYAMALAMGGVGALLVWTALRPSEPIVYTSRAIRIPRMLPGLRPRWHRYSDVFYITRDETGAGRRLVLCFRTRRLSPFVVHEAHLLHPAAFDELESALDRGLRLHPEERSVRGRGELSRRMLVVPWLGIGLGLGLVGVHVLVLQASEGPWLWDLLRLGASSPWLVAQGEWHRIVSANVLHLNAAHLGMNLVALLVFAVVLEGLLGRWRIALVLICGGCIGMAASVLWGRGFATVGASGAIMGLVGCCLYVMLRHRRSLPLNPMSGLVLALFMLPLLAAEFALLGGFDSVVHAAGLASGAILGACMVDRGDIAAGPTSQGLGLRVCVVGLGLVVVVAVAWSGAASRGLQLRGLVSDLLESGDEGNDVKRLAYAKGLAWLTAADRRATMEDLESARLALENALAGAVGPVGAIDAFAALEFLLGRREVAERLLGASVELEGGGFDGPSVSRLAWYAWTNGTRVEGGSVPTVVDRGLGAGPPLALESPIEYSDGLTMHILVLENDQPRGFLRVRFGSFSAGSKTFGEGWGRFRGDGELSYRVTYAAIPAEPVPAGASEWRYWPWSPRSVDFLEERAAEIRRSVGSL